MGRKPDKVILFPKWKQTLEQESLHALEEKKYDTALEKLNQLLDYNYQEHEILMGKIICLMELNRYDEAQELCESLLAYKSENYYHYLHIYLTILFQTDQYQLLIEQAESALSDGNVPSEMTDMFSQLFEMTKKMQYEIHLEKSHHYFDELTEAVSKKEYRKQWRLIENLKQLTILPPKNLYTYLIREEIHPVIKTTIFQWLQQSGIDEMIDIHKEYGQISVKPASFPVLNEHALKKQMTLLLGNQEQKDPTLYYLMEKLLYMYFYVCYPVLPRASDISSIAKALRLLGADYLRGGKKQERMVDTTVQSYIRDIQLCEKLYLSILG